MDRLAAALGMLGLAVALGALAVGELVVAPGLAELDAFIDANLAKTLTAPLHLRCAMLVFIGTLAVAAATPRWVRSRVGTTMALCAVGCTAAYRLAVLPKAYATWALADLVAGRPPDKIVQAQELANNASWLAAAAVALLLGIMVLAVRGHVAAVPKAKTPKQPAPAKEGTPAAAPA